MLLIFVLVYFDVVIFFIKKIIHSNYVICTVATAEKNIFHTLLFPYSISPSLRDHLK